MLKATILVLAALANQAYGSQCVIGCPGGWNQWGPFGTNCYLMPSQPLHLDTFKNQQQHCRDADPTSYPLVVNDLIEQALGTVVALQYAPSYALDLTNAHLWLGAYVNRDNQWVALDGSSITDNVLMAATELIGAKNGSCLSADPKTLGIWTPLPCSDNTGAVICEMPPRQICDGNLGGILPISPIDITNAQDLLPNMPSLPILGQILGSGKLLDGVTNLLGGSGGPLGAVTGLLGGVPLVGGLTGGLPLGLGNLLGKRNSPPHPEHHEHHEHHGHHGHHERGSRDLVDGLVGGLPLVGNVLGGGGLGGLTGGLPLGLGNLLGKRNSPPHPHGHEHKHEHQQVRGRRNLLGGLPVVGNLLGRGGLPLGLGNLLGKRNSPPHPEHHGHPEHHEHHAHP